VVEEVVSPRLSRLIERGEAEANVGNFEGRVRYLSSSLIVTIPVKVARELGITLGDRVQVQIRKKMEAVPALATGQRSP